MVYMKLNSIETVKPCCPEYETVCDNISTFLIFKKAQNQQDGQVSYLLMLQMPYCPLLDVLNMNIMFTP